MGCLSIVVLKKHWTSEADTSQTSQEWLFVQNSLLKSFEYDFQCDLQRKQMGKPIYGHYAAICFKCNEIWYIRS